jgi:Fe-S-cluster-containing dehydrogenase component
MTLTRRTFLKVAGAAGAVSVVGPAGAEEVAGARGVLVDTTLCIGCRGCEAACSEANHLPEPAQAGSEAVFEQPRSTGPQAFTVVNRASKLSPHGSPRYAKSQCLHCLEPACASACPVRALEKTPEGPVIYHRNRCMGCRYCMVACPFGVPKYEYDKALPYVRKCTFCAERQAQGKPPACAEVCPTGALLFGERAQLLETAHARIYENPDRYVHRIYGEEEAGGTSWLYLSDLPFESLGLPTGVRNSSYPELTKGALSIVPMVMTLWPPLLMSLYTFTKNRRESEAADAKKEDHHD